MSLARCHFCDLVLPKEKAKHCSRCKVAVYCSEKCQAEDWKTGRWLPHKKTCAKGGDSINEDFQSLIKAEVTLEDAIEMIRKRDVKTPALTLLIKHWIMKHSDANDPYTIAGARPAGPGQPSKLVDMLYKLAIEIAPQNAPLPWLVAPGFMNVLLHDDLLDADQDFLRFNQKKKELDAEDEEDMTHEEKMKELIPYTKLMAKNQSAQFYSFLVLNILAKIAMNNIPEHGMRVMKRLIYLASDDLIQARLQSALAPPIKVLMARNKPLFLEAGGLKAVVSLFKLLPFRLLMLSYLTQVNKAEWVKYGTCDVLCTVLSDLLIPGLLRDQMDNFQYNYSDVPEVALGKQHKNGGTSRSSQMSRGTNAAGHGFTPFGLSLLNNIVSSDALHRKNARYTKSTEESGFVQAIRALTVEGDEKSEAFLFYVREIIGLDAKSEDEEGSDDDYTKRVVTAVGTWKSMSHQEKQKYFWKTYSDEERSLVQSSH